MKIKCQEVKAALKMSLLLIILSCVLFFSAGSFYFMNAWLYVGILFINMTAIFIYLAHKDPELLQKRFEIKEKEGKQRFVQKIGVLPLLSGFILSGLDYRFEWSEVPDAVVLTAVFLIFTGYAIFFKVLTVNSYASRVIKVQENQRVIESGLYSIVRHPMYLSLLIIYFFSPLILGSYYALLPMFLYPYIFYLRILNEEEVLKKDLKGYEEYIRKVKYRIIPFLW